MKDVVGGLMFVIQWACCRSMSSVPLYQFRPQICPVIQPKPARQSVPFLLKVTASRCADGVRFVRGKSNIATCDYARTCETRPDKIPTPVPLVDTRDGSPKFRVWISKFRIRILLLFKCTLHQWSKCSGISRSTKNSNNVGSMCNMSGRCVWSGLQLNYFYTLAAVTTEWGTNSAHL